MIDVNTMRFLIVTPSLNRRDDLRRCIASVRDQVEPDIKVHHHIQDAQSSDGTVEFLREYIARDLLTDRYQLTFSSEADTGMYDAVSKGWRRAAGDADVVAWLNCDEQYLPGTLSKVSRYFAENPDADVLFGDVLVVRPDGSLLCARRAIRPDQNHMLTSYLTVFSAAMFMRIGALQTYALYPDPEWKILGDVDLVDRMVAAGIRLGLLHEFLASFTDSGANISLTASSAARERRALAARLPALVQAMGPVWTLLHRLRKLCSGAYRRQALKYSIFTDSLVKRTDFLSASAPAVWKRRL